ncbi:hypothetical protein PGTUg99_003066 [Puccinia graminis f. sp. tritici]|uniref:Uncharacterized protein n=1 Tax=Puccinia graminis f. sp. tritici TaxID=56615 RepID=A0A5B0Q157_PUCGR|nr:hypothetical protein PGTUg99_003066 [Puccinia graminis f. sp. tritici]
MSATRLQKKQHPESARTSDFLRNLRSDFRCIGDRTCRVVSCSFQQPNQTR